MNLDSLHTIRWLKTHFTGKDAMSNTIVAAFALLVGAPLVIPFALVIIAADIALCLIPQTPNILRFIVYVHVAPVIWLFRKLYGVHTGRRNEAIAEIENAKRLDSEQRERTENQQRDDIRMRCQLLYDRHAVELAERFPRSQFWSYMETYLSHSQPLAIVERREIALIEMIKECLVDVGKPLIDPLVNPETIGDVAAFFEEQRQQLKALNYDDDTLASMIAALNAEEDKAIAEFMARFRKRRRG